MGITKGIPRGFTGIFQGKIINYNIDDNSKGREIPFIFSPNSLSDSVQASFQQQAIPGSSGPQVTYSSTGARTIGISLSIPLDYIPPSSYSNLEDYLDAFRALVYPKYHKGSGMVSSPHCRLITTNLDIDGVCATCNIEYKTDRYANDGSMAAEVSLSFIEILQNVQDIDANWVINRTKKVSSANTSGTSGVINNGNSIDIIQEERETTCTVTLKGQSRYEIESNTGSLKENIKNGTFVDQGVTYTKQSTYTIIKLYAMSYDTPIMSITNIKKENGSWKAVKNGAYVTTLYTGAPDNYGISGHTNYHAIIYLPYKDGNIYEQESAVVRFVDIKVVR